MIFDLIILIVFLIAIWKGYRIGLIVGLFSLLAFFIGMAAALKLSANVALFLSDSNWVSARWVPILSFIFVFLLVAYLIKLGAKFLEKTIQLVLLGWVNHIGGILFYSLLYGLGLSVILFYASQIQIIPSEWLANSKLYPIFARLTPKIMDQLGEWIPIFKGMFIELEQFFERMANKMRH